MKTNYIELLRVDLGNEVVSLLQVIDTIVYKDGSIVTSVYYDVVVNFNQSEQDFQRCIIGSIECLQEGQLRFYDYLLECNEDTFFRTEWINQIFYLEDECNDLYTCVITEPFSYKGTPELIGYVIKEGISHKVCLKWYKLTFFNAYLYDKRIIHYNGIIR